MRIRYFGYVRPISGWIFPFRFLWIGWIQKQVTSEEATTFSDDTPFEYIYNSADVVYLAFGFTMNSVMRKLDRRVRKIDTTA